MSTSSTPPRIALALAGGGPLGAIYEIGALCALDESLQGCAGRLPALARLPLCSAIVLKPTTLGGFGTCIELAAQAGSLGKAAVVSHALEGPLGWLANAQLALALAPGAAAGLWPMASGALSPLVRDGCLQPTTHHGLGAIS